MIHGNAYFSGFPGCERLRHGLAIVLNPLPERILRQMVFNSVQAQVLSYYNNFSDKLVADYWQGNPRIVAAIQHALRWIPADAKRVLDIGCGIGWSTREIARHRPKAEVLGLDISPGELKVARTLADENNVRFEVQDFCNQDCESLEKFDAIVMLDVYEHFPVSKRAEVHAALKRLLTDNGIVILAFPTPKHQAFLRKEHPGGLQPVDEDVTHNDVTHLAEDVAGKVEYFKNMTIWRSDDYAHVTIVRGQVPQISTKGCAVRSIKLESQAKRRARIRSKLNARVLVGGLVVSASDGPRLCIACSQLGAVSETFIRDHITRLPMPVRVLHGGSPCYDGEGRNVGPSRIARLAQALSRWLGGSGLPWLYDKPIARFLRRNNIAAVLTEYGTVGVKVMKACTRAGVPLVVHFHGYDAYKNEIIESNRQQYAEMFEYASAIVAVSQDMKQQLIAIGAPAEKIFWIPCGVDTTVFDKAAPENAEIQFLAVGRFVEKKAPQLTLLAFSKVLKTCPDSTLKMIGDGQLFGLCQQMAQALGISDAVEFTGFQDHDFVRAAMQKALAFVQHSVRPLDGDSEGTPVGVTEAQATGLPVVATAHAGIKDVVIDGETGFLVDELDVDGMAEAMIKLARDPDLAARLGRAGRQRVIEKFSFQTSLQKLAQVIKTASGGVIRINDSTQNGG